MNSNPFMFQDMKLCCLSLMLCRLSHMRRIPVVMKNNPKAGVLALNIEKVSFVATKAI